MFLHFLTDNLEQTFFLKFAYLLAVADNEDGSENIPTRAYLDNSEEGKYEFEEFAPGFAMQTSELLMLRKFAEEMGMTWAPVSSYGSMSSLLFSSLNLGSAAIGVWSGQTTKSPDALEKVARENSVADMLKMAMEELNNTSDRSAVLKLVLAAIFAQANAHVFAVEKRKAILMEATAMAYADGNVSEHEQELLMYFCELCHLDKELLEDFKEITQEFSKTYAKSLELITE
ncbi:hypothetical protein [Desulfovibrio sp.]|uniref:hypothetical protein n=1 Tax=Desulfovibrio sp. TaxID=885 RepID=UPI0025B86A32|nr:hypothetical protein [Desulfovibrio sp.]